MDKSITKMLTSFRPMTLTHLLWGLLLSAIWKWKNKKQDVIVIAGMYESGKTLLFHRLFHNWYRKTTHNPYCNEEVYTTLSGKSFNIVDLPSYNVKFQEYFSMYKERMKGMIYVIDSVTIDQYQKYIAKRLYEILVDPVFRKNRVFVLIACTKQDKPEARTVHHIKYKLELELHAIRLSNYMDHAFVHGKVDKPPFILGQAHWPFLFSDVENDVVFVKVSSVRGPMDREYHVRAVRTWIEGLAVDN